MIRKILSLTVLVSLPVVASADYLVELDTSFGVGELSIDDDFSGEESYDTELFGGAGTVFFKKVSTAAVPVREAGFLSKVSSFSVFYSQREGDLDFSTFENELTQVQGRFVFSGANIILGASIFDGSGKLGTDTSREGVGVQIGKYLSDASALWLSYSDGEYAIERNGSFSDIKTDETAVALVYRNVSNRIAWQVGVGHFERFETLLFREAKGISVEGEVTWYFHQKLGVGVELSSNIYSDVEFSDDASGAVFSPKISYDMTENFGIYANIRSEFVILEDDDGDEFDISDVSYSFGATVRF